MHYYSFNNQVIGSIITDKANICGEKIYLKYEDGEEVSYQELDKITNRIANGLSNLGIGKGDKVALFLPNSLEMVYLWYACSKLGAIDVPINLANKGFFLSHVINDSNSQTIVMDRDLMDRLLDIQDDVPNLKKVVLWSRDASSNQDFPNLRFQLFDYNLLLESSTERPPTKIEPVDIQTIIYTSGTTGPSKGVMLPNAQQYLEAREFCEATRAESSDVFFTCLPLFHANARLMCVLPAMLAETKVVIRERLSATRFWDQIKRAGGTIFNSLGAMATFLHNQPEKNDDGNNPVRICMAAPMPVDIHESFASRFNVKIIEGYGLTETGMITYNPYEKSKIGSCGKETSTFKIRILDKYDNNLPPKAVGEIAVQSLEPYAMSQGYYNMPEKTVEAFRNFYFHTGDAGFLDEDGYLFFVDRMKDYIRRRGENISSFEVERVINFHASVLESAAVGVKSEEGEDEVKVVVVLKDGKALKPEELFHYCEQRMPYFAVPRYIEFAEALPKTPNEKVKKNQIREAGVNVNTWDREKNGYELKR